MLTRRLKMRLTSLLVAVDELSCSTCEPAELQLAGTACGLHVVTMDIGSMYGWLCCQ